MQRHGASHYIEWNFTFKGEKPKMFEKNCKYGENTFMLQTTLLNSTLSKCKVQIRLKSSLITYTLNAPLYKCNSTDIIWWKINSSTDSIFIFTVWTYSVGSAFFISLSGLWGYLLLPLLNGAYQNHVMNVLVGLSCGSLITSSLCQLIPEVRRWRYSNYRVNSKN